ncbi:hypothetical protein GCM10009775_31260 [Microbacterium aoyamense]|uniref:HNH nuclease domain-containing protein n=1 Tax=Microbacterium aoyamense TaxID=344166 RepID=A0ABN2PXX1_9MICO|nr:HNH endonuclease signature motif containing protein [Microbacterium aoyamense]
MQRTPAPPAERLLAAAGRVARAVPGLDPSVAATQLDDDALLGVLADATEARKALDLLVSVTSAEVARRSHRELGYDGLAQRKGHRNVTSLVQNITGQSTGDVRRTLRAGEELAPPAMDATTPPPPEWLAALRAALASGRLGQQQFHAIRTGLGEPPVERYPDLDPDFLPTAWGRAVALLIDEATSLPVEGLRDAARIARDRLDPVGVTLRFEERYTARSFRTWTDEAGQHHGRFVFDDEAAAWVDAILQAALRPRRGPRFVSSASPHPSVVDDPRTNEQLQYDTLIAVLRTGAAADPAQSFGDRQPGVRIVVEASAIAAPDERGEMRVVGVGHLEDGGAALPPGVIEKFLCDAGAVPVEHDAFGRPLDVGREHRLFTRTQRIAIAARDGGCIWPSCSAPVSQSEYHHIDHWWEHHGKTDVDDGVPLCRNCHLRLHNQGWRITRERDPATGIDTYWLHPPPDPVTGEVAEPTRLSSKSPRRFEAA